MLGRLVLRATLTAPPPTLVQPPPSVARTDRHARRRLSDRLRLGGGVVYLLAIGLLSRAFEVDPASAAAYALFWAGLGGCFVGSVVIATAPGARPGHHVLALAMIGLSLWIPFYLRSPDVSIFQDELLHVQSLQLMNDLKTVHIPYTFFQVPGDYPGLELLGLSTLYATGLPLEQVVRYVPLAIHVFIPVVAYWALRSCGIPPPLAFFGGVIYMANHSYYFFHSAFSYETLGVLFFLVAATFGIRLAEPRRGGGVAISVILLLAVLGAVATHHVSSAMATGLLITLAVVVLVVARPRRIPLVDAALFALVAWSGWVLYETQRTANYLFGNLAERAIATLSLLQGQQSQARQLFWNSPVPPLEQLVAYGYPLLIAALIGFGLLRQGRVLLAGWRADRRVHLTPVQLALALFGPFAWFATAPLIVTRSSDVVYRAWPFLFLGVGLYAAYGVQQFLQGRISGRVDWRRVAPAFGLAGMVLAGAVILNDNHAGRFRPTELHSSVGPEALTPDVRAAAGWLEGDAGRFHRVIGDAFNEIGFAVWGMQVTDVWSNWLPFYTQDPELAQGYIDDLQADFVVADWRDTRYLPRYVSYYNSAEFIDPRVLDVSREGSLLAAANLAKFDRMPRLWRIYDNGDIVIYQVRPRVQAASAGAEGADSVESSTAAVPGQ